MVALLAPEYCRHIPHLFCPSADRFARRRQIEAALYVYRRSPGNERPEEPTSGTTRRWRSSASAVGGSWHSNLTRKTTSSWSARSRQTAPGM
jgi:hypothetical protein